MKKILFTLITVSALLTARAQSNQPAKDTTVYSAVEKIPEFPGGTNGFNRYLEANIHYPAATKQNNLHGRVILTLIIEKDGTVSHVRVAKSVAPSLDAEAIRVVKASPKWNPGMQSGNAVRVAYTVPVYFDLSGK